MKVFKFFILFLIIPVFVMAGARSESNTPAQSGPVPISVAYLLQPGETPPDLSLPVGKLIQEKLNVAITGEWWLYGTETEKRNLALASGVLPDLFQITNDQGIIYGAEGVFEPWDDLLTRFAPNIRSYMTPENTPPLRSPNDGKIYIIPRYYQLATMTDWVLTYRKDILEEMGEPEPDTVDGWYQLFKKVQARYPDMIVLCERFRNIDYFVHSAFDMGRIDGNFGIIGSDFDKRQIVYLPITNEWRDMLQFYSKLYAENILDHEYLTIQFDDWWERKLGAGRAFACWTQNMARADMVTNLAHSVGLNNVQWTVAETVQNYKTGERVQYKTTNPWVTFGFALNAKSRVKETAAKYVDFFFSPEFHAFNWFSKDTRYDNLYADRSTMTEDEWNAYIGFYGFYHSPQFTPYSVVKTNPPQIASEKHMDLNMKYVRSIPSITRSGNIDNWLSATTDLTAYIETAMDEFIVGRRPFSQWDAYVQEVRRMGLDNAVATVQGWYDDFWRAAGR